MLDGTLQEGDKMMSTTQFAATYKVNPGTVVRGYGLLVDEGLVEKRRGIGMFVAIGAITTLTESERTRFFAEQLPPVIERAKLLQIEREELLKQIELRYRHE